MVVCLPVMACQVAVSKTGNMTDLLKKCWELFGLEALAGVSEADIPQRMRVRIYYDTTKKKLQPFGSTIALATSTLYSNQTLLLELKPIEEEWEPYDVSGITIKLSLYDPDADAFLPEVRRPRMAEQSSLCALMRLCVGGCVLQQSVEVSSQGKLAALRVKIEKLLGVPVLCQRLFKLVTASQYRVYSSDDDQSSLSALQMSVVLSCLQCVVVMCFPEPVSRFGDAVTRAPLCTWNVWKHQHRHQRPPLRPPPLRPQPPPPL